MKFIYADPPYIGQARKRYQCDEIDHPALIRSMCADADAWALSLSSTTLRQILPMCPEDVRIGAWVKPFCAFKKNVNPAYAWEPVIFWHTRRRTRNQDTERDWCAEAITLRKGLVGAKPLGFSFWLFDFANLTPEDQFTDLFPGSGAVTVAWKLWCEQKKVSESPTTRPVSRV